MAPKLPASLVRYLREGRCVLFAGSGLSAWGGIPTWDRLLQRMIEEIRAEEPDSQNLDELNGLLARKKYLEVADHCKEVLKKQRYSKILAEQLRGDEGEIPEPHQVIVNLPFVAVVTTNYDRLLERAYGNSPKNPTHRDLDALGSLLFDGSFFILKAHGDIHRPESLVLTARDYQEIIHSNPAFNEVFSAILLTNAILFVGYSLTDPDFRLLLDRQLITFKEYIPDRYALMSSDSVSGVERDVLQRTAGIRVLPYDLAPGEGSRRHQEVLTFLRALRDEVERGSPSQRPALMTPKTIPVPSAEVRRPSPLSSTILSLNLRGRREVAVVVSKQGVERKRGTGQLPDRASLTSLLRPTLHAHSAGPEEFRKVGQALAQCFSEEVMRELQRVPTSDVIILDLDAELETLPWEWTYVKGEWLFLRNPVVRAPIGVSDAARGYPLVRRPIRVLLIGDTMEGDQELGLPDAAIEVKEIASAYHNHASVETLIGAQATFDEVVTHLETGDYDVVHFAGHAWLDTQEAYLMLHEGVKLHSSELRPWLNRRPPALLVLNSHYTAYVPPGVRPLDIGRDERPRLYEEDMPIGPTLGGRIGFTEVASKTGVGAFIGCIGSPGDPVAKDIGVALHEELLKGTSLAMALHKTRSESCLAEIEKSDGNLSAFAYVMSGYPELTLT